jgi:hypothetical protein
MRCGKEQFRIRVILRRIQILESVPVHWITDPDPALSADFMMPTKTIFSTSFLLRHIYISLQRLQVIKKLERVEIKVFHNYFSLLMEGSGTEYVQIITDPDPKGPKTYRYRTGTRNNGCPPCSTLQERFPAGRRVLPPWQIPASSLPPSL